MALRADYMGELRYFATIDREPTERLLNIAVANYLRARKRTDPDARRHLERC
jgi:hypothetical protein